MNQIENMHVGEVEKAFVLWDMGNCPIPDGHDPLTVVAKIQMAVEKSGHVRRNGQISITAIGSKLTEIPGEDVMSRLSSFEISLKHSHLYIHDLDEWADANPPPSTMMIIDDHERIGWIASNLSDFEDAGYRILLAYPQRTTPLPRSFSKQWDWDALVTDEQETTTTTTSLVYSQGRYNDEHPLACEVCFVAVKSFEDFTAHLKSVEHEYGEWDRFACKNGVDRTIRENLPFGRSSESPTSEHYGCLVDLIGRAGVLADALNLVKSLPFEADALVLGALLGACKIHEDAELGNEVGKQLIGLQPEHYVALSTLKALGNNWAEAEEMRKVMVEAGIRKSLHIVSCLNVFKKKM
uniref:NYN domain-containing protein n=1 Tax=Brassica campestris TaxID=3711 RepID=M4DTU8_BRACM